ncbi:response regulator [Sulfitobacter aestuarii]|uniref:histidine kinase n=1 Tax=Sulfitobacter aestuarii TaxID=2161676 RepID=A0ABW5U2K0_9RHOB
MTGRAVRLSDWFARNRVTIRISSLSAGLLFTLMLSAAVMAWELLNNLHRVEDSTERFRRLQVAAEADSSFGELRFWLTDLSVSLLTLSERRAEAARERLETHLAQMESFAPDATQEIRAGVEAYVENALRAADAYTEDRRVIGNTLSSQARIGSSAVNAALEALMADLAREAAQSEQAATQAARDAVMRAIIAFGVIALVGALLTIWVVRSILKPLGAIDTAIGELNAGASEVTLPPEGPDELGRVSGTVRALRDSQIRQRQLKAEAEQQRNTILTAIETIPDGFALFDAGHRLVLTNARYRRMFAAIEDVLVPGVSFREILRAVLADDPGLAGGQPEEEWIAERLAHHASPETTRREIRIGPAWVQVTKSKTPDGGTVAIYSDITDLLDKQAQLQEAHERAEAANKAKSRFLASMSHELRTPLNAIIGYSEMLIEDARDEGDETTIADLEKIMASGQHLLGLINDILDLSKIEAGKMELHFETFDIARLVQDVAATIKPLVATNDNELVVRIDTGIGEIETDKTKLRQNLFNLLSNAAKFTKSGRIELIVQDAEEAVEFVVRDNGIGLTEEQKSRLFKPFEQADSSTTREYGGTGLGLAIVKQFTEMLGGEVRVESTPGKGASFTLKVTLGGREKLPGTRSDGVGSGASVLVIDDDPSARRSMADLLTREGFRPLLAGDAGAGLALAEAHRPDAIVLDIIMPEKDGWSVLRELKNNAALCEIPVILATVLGDRDMGLALGAVDHLTKPIDQQRLVDILNAFSASGEREALVVDDDPGTRALFRRILVREGWSVREAADGMRALAQLDIKLPSVVILDLMMPNLDGFETLRSLRARDDCAALPVIIATSKDLSRDEMKWLRANAREVVSKGKDGRTELLSAIRRHVTPRAPQGETG